MPPFVGAFKTLPLHALALPLAVAVWRCLLGNVCALQLLCCPFGAIASVHAWQRVANAIQLILSKLFFIVYACYVDDLFGLDAETHGNHEHAEPAGIASMARWVIADLLGWEMDSEKAVTNSQVFVALGVHVEADNINAKLIFRIPEEKLVALRAEIAAILRTGRLPPSSARKLAGKLSWGASALFGRGARVYLAPLFRHASKNTTVLSRRLRQALEWWLRFLGAVPDRTVPFAPRVKETVTLYVDATGDGHLAWVAAVGAHREWSAAVVPKTLRRWVCWRRTQIATWELVAALCAVWSFLRQPRVCSDHGVQINVFIDSAVALGTLLRGSSRQQDWNALVAGLWFEVVSTGTLLLAWRVPSKQNLADIPTRPANRHDDVLLLRQQGFVEVPWEWPSPSLWG